MKLERSIVRDTVLADRIAKDGYFIVPFLDEDELEYFRNLYKRYHPQDPETFYKSYFSSDKDYKLQVENDIIKKFNEKLGYLFQNHRTFGGMFVAKPPLEKGHFTAHQDWSFTDEWEWPSYNMWCPLDDVNDENGNLNVIRGSHKFLNTIRGFGTPDVYDHLHKDLEANMLSLPMKAGEVVIFYHGLIHGSTKNITDNARVSLGLSIVHSEAPLRYHYYDEENKVLDEFESNPEFYIDFVDHRESRPTNIPHLRERDFKFERLSYNQLESLVTENHGKFNRVRPTKVHLSNPERQNAENQPESLFNRVKALFR